MAFFNEFPHTRTYDSDLGWLIRRVGENIENLSTLQEWETAHKEEYANLYDQVQGLVNSLVEVVIPWDSSIAYKIYSIVEYQGTNYIAIRDVPVGAMITNTDYWQPANTALEQINAIGVVVDSVRRGAINSKNTETEMISDNTIEAGAIIKTLGYSAINDGGGALYYIVEDEPSGYHETLDNGLFALMIVDKYITPEQFGAVGDGVTDDATAFEKMLSAGRSIKLVPGKNYALSHGMVMPDGFSMDMSGSTITRSALESVYSASWKNFKETDVEITGYNGAGNITIKNGTFDSPQFLLMHGKNIIFDNVQMRNGFGHMIQLAGCKDVTIKNCGFHGSIVSGLEAINFDICEPNGFPFLPTGSIAFDNTAEDNVIISECDFRPDGDRTWTVYMDSAIGNHSSVAGHYHYRCKFNNNTIRTTKTHGIGMFGFQESEACNNIIIVTGGVPFEFGECSNVSFIGNSGGGDNFTPAAYFKHRLNRSYAISIIDNIMILIDPTKFYENDPSIQVSFKKLQRIRLTAEAGSTSYTLPEGFQIATMPRLWLTFSGNGKYWMHEIQAFNDYFGDGQRYALYGDPIMTNAVVTITHPSTITVSADSNVTNIRAVYIER